MLQNETKTPTVSVVMPIRNEGKYIAACIDSLLLQDYPQEDMEWIFVDGCSTDNTKEIIHAYIDRYPNLIKLYDNPGKTVPYAMNIGIPKARGKYIVRLDAHAEYSPDYISKSVYYLDTTDADNVGGIMETKAHTKMGKRIALMLSCPFGVGNAKFRINGDDGYVDTVPFGTFRRETFEKYGLFDERLTRNQDNEMNWRIRRGGGKVYMSKDIKLNYYCRETISTINKMAYINGKWNIITMRICPGSMGSRHFIPLLFLISLVVMPILSSFFMPAAILFGAEMSLYLLLDLVYSIKGAMQAKDDNKFVCALTLLILFPLFHICYGFGSIIGLLTLCTRKFSRDFVHKKPQQSIETKSETELKNEPIAK